MRNTQPFGTFLVALGLVVGLAGHSHAQWYCQCDGAEWASEDACSMEGGSWVCEEESDPGLPHEYDEDRIEGRHFASEEEALNWLTDSPQTIPDSFAQTTIESDSFQNAEVREFSGQQEFLAALSEEVARLQLKDVQVHRGASDEVVGVSFKKQSDIEQVLMGLGGEADAITIGDKTVKVKVLLRLLHRLDRASATKHSSATADAAKGTSMAALLSGLPEDITVCDPNEGDFCSYNSTRNTHFSVFGFGYHEVSSGTTLTGERIYGALSRPTPCPPRTHCSPPYEVYCNPGDILFYRCCTGPGSRSTPWCYKGHTELYLTNYYFANIDGRPEMIHQEFKAASDKTKISLGHTTFGKFIYPCRTGACKVDGICAEHSSYGNGASTVVTTAAGSYDCE